MKAIATFASILAFSAVACAPVYNEPPGERIESVRALNTTPSVPAPIVEQLAANQRSFALSLRSSALSENQNALFSPYSISTALTMAYAGARGNTASEMRSTLRLTIPDEQVHAAQNALERTLSSRPEAARGRPMILRTANALFVQRGFSIEPSFADTLTENYRAGLRALDFRGNPDGAARAINGWVSEQTEGKIPSLFPAGSIHSNTRLTLVNALYFYGPWRYEFEASQTTPAPFTLASGETTSVPTMRRSATYRVAAGENWRAIELPYSGEQLSMVVVVPTGSVSDFEASLTQESLDRITSSLAPHPQGSVRVWLPKFQFSHSFGVTPALQALGMTSAFNGRANFSGITSQEPLLIESVVHQAFIAVDERGTEAAAATGITFGPTAVAIPTEFKVDRPFVFLLRDNPTGTLLFMGHVFVPSGAST